MYGLSISQKIDSKIRLNGGETLICYTVLDDYGNKETIIDTFSPSTGYQVGVSNILTEEYTSLTDEKLLFMVHSLSQAENNSCLGFWLDKGTLYVDECLYFDDLDVAMRVARNNKELAIWDWKNSTEIKVCEK